MKIYSVDPSTGEQIAEFEAASTQAAIDAVTRAREAQKAWRKRAPEERFQLLRGFGQMLEKRKNEVIAIISRESRSSPLQSRA